MRRVLALLAVAGCGTDPPPPTTTPEAATETPTAAADVAAPTAAGGSAVDASIVGAAQTAAGVEKAKLRVNASGALVKQALYHTDASKIPEPVKALAKKEFPGGKATRYETEVYADIGEIFEVEVKTKDGTKCEVAAAADGTLRYKECHVKPKDLPVDVTRKLGELFPKGKILEAETKKGPEVDEVTVEIEEGGREFYVRLKPDGTPLETLIRVPAVLEVPVK